MHECKEKMKRTSAKPGIPLGAREALWERPCNFCHWSLSEAESATSQPEGKMDQSAGRAFGSVLVFV